LGAAAILQWETRAFNALVAVKKNGPAKLALVFFRHLPRVSAFVSDRDRTTTNCVMSGFWSNTKCTTDDVVPTT